jgi:hypothetical protein
MGKGSVGMAWHGMAGQGRAGQDRTGQGGQAGESPGSRARRGVLCTAGRPWDRAVLTARGGDSNATGPGRATSDAMYICLGGDPRRLSGVQLRQTPACTRQPLGAGFLISGHSGVVLLPL